MYVCENMCELEDEICALKEKLEGTILDMNNFIRQLEIRGLMTKELGEFIEGYMKFCNN